MISSEQIEEFLKGADPEKYIVSVEFDYVSDYIYRYYGRAHHCHCHMWREGGKKSVAVKKNIARDSLMHMPQPILLKCSSDPPGKK